MSISYFNTFDRELSIQLSIIEVSTSSLHPATRFRVGMGCGISRAEVSSSNVPTIANLAQVSPDHDVTTTLAPATHAKTPAKGGILSRRSSLNSRRSSTVSSESTSASSPGNSQTTPIEETYPNAVTPSNVNFQTHGCATSVSLHKSQSELMNAKKPKVAQLVNSALDDFAILSELVSPGKLALGNETQRCEASLARSSVGSNATVRKRAKSERALR